MSNRYKIFLLKYANFHGTFCYTHFEVHPGKFQTYFSIFVREEFEKMSRKVKPRKNIYLKF